MQVGLSTKETFVANNVLQENASSPSVTEHFLNSDEAAKLRLGL